MAQKYCGDCKSSFEELSKIIQKVLATRKELVAYDNARKAHHSSHLPSTPSPASQLEETGRPSVTKCYGCASASVEHCLTLLRALASKPASREELYQQGLIKQLLEYNLRRGNQVPLSIIIAFKFQNEADIKASSLTLPIHFR